ncbi:hypothetical protein K9M42_02750 [Patescibacteria group bacterium]|nr:hypothetical protein [Patescibacteria group bacterium]
MGTTKFYGLTFFDFSDTLDSSLSIQKEIERFVVIDKQLYGLYSVFGNGVINGWDVQNNGYNIDNGISVLITEGIGIIKYMVAESMQVQYLNNLPSNSEITIFANSTGQTLQNRIVNFSFVIGGDIPEDTIKIATVVTGNENIVYVDNDDRDYLSFEQTIKDEVDNHKHRGTPSKIDLQEETKNQMPGARIEGIDASKIISGTLNLEQIPKLDHNDLENNGLLTHAALDSFVSTLEKSNKELLGEISSVNLLRAVIFLKYLYPDIDSNFINEFICIPGISSDNIIDFESSTANIDLDSQCISGKPVQIGQFVSTYWNDQNSFYNAYKKTNVIISDGEVSLKRSGENIEIIENFETFAPGVDLSFDKNIVLRNDYAKVISEGDNINKIEGKYSGEFNANSDLRVLYSKNIKKSDSSTGTSVGIDLSEDYDELAMWVKTNNSNHKPVYFYLINGNYEINAEIPDENQIGPFEIIPENHITSNQDDSKNNFEEKVINLSQIKQVPNLKNIDNLTKIVFYTDELDDDFIFYIDNIYARRTNLVAPSGSVRLRYSTQAQVTFHSIFYEGSVPNNTNINVRVKTSNSEEALSRAPYTMYLNSGQIFATEGTNVEIEVNLLSSDETVSPVLRSIELRMLVDSDLNGFEITEKDDFERGTLENLIISDDIIDNQIELSDPINIEGYYFSQANSINEIDDNNVGVYGFAGNKMPLAPNQTAIWEQKPYKKFDYITSVKRMHDKSYLIADTHNDRVLRVDNEGNLIEGFGSTYFVDDNLYPVSIVYNPNLYILTLVLSKPVSLNDISKISLYGGVEEIQLSSEDTILSNSKCNNKVIEISLSEDNYVKLKGYDNLSINFSKGVFTEDINIPDGISSLLNIYSQFDVFVGNFVYMDNIRHPIEFNKIDEKWIVGNVSKPALFYNKNNINFEDINVPSIMEFSLEENIINFNYSFSKIYFSDFSMGGIYKISEGQMVVAGVIESEYGAFMGTSEGTDYNSIASNALAGWVGVVAIIDKVNQKYNIIYNSPDGLYPSDVDVDTEGNIIVSESSFTGSNGRLIKLDDYGNITWMYGMGFFDIINSINVTDENNIIVSS